MDQKIKKFLPEKISLNTPFVEKKTQNIICMTLYSFNGLFQALPTDIACISFLAKSAVDPKFSLFFVDVFTSKIYTYPMKKNDLAKKWNYFIMPQLKQEWVK